MVQVTITTTGAGNWTVPGDCPAGTAITVETWGAGAGGSGRSGTTAGGGGGGGAYASTTYYVTPGDVAAGSIPYDVGDGSVGSAAGVQSSAGDDTFWGSPANLIPTSVATIGSATGVIGSGGALPTDWDWVNPGGLTATVQASGFDANGFPYIDIRFNGTATAGEWYLAFAWNAPASASLSYTASAYLALTAGSLPSGTSLNGHATDGAFAYISTPITTSLSLNSTLTRYSASGTSPASTAHFDVVLQATLSAIAYDFTLRLGPPQLEQAGSATAWKSTPGYTLAKGGGGTRSSSQGGLGGATATSVGTTKFAGGNGATRAQLGGGGGSAGPNGAGGNSTTGTGGTGNNGSGGAGGAGGSGNPGNPGTSNVLGGGGGGGSSSVASGAVAGAGGAPGGGGGGQTTSVGAHTGGTGGRGQIRLTYTASAPPAIEMPDVPVRPRALSRAVLVASGMAPLSFETGGGAPPEDVTLDKWAQPPSQPTLRARSAAQHASGPAEIDPTALTVPEAVSEDRWHLTPSQPAIVRRLSAAVAAASGASWVAPEIVAVEEVTPDKWYQAPSQPVVARKLSAAVRASSGDVEAGQPEHVLLPSWTQPSSQPVEARRQPVAVLASSGQAPVDPAALTQPETVSEDRWHLTPSQPRITRAMPEAVRSSGPSEIDPTALTRPETVSVDRWQPPNTQPFRISRLPEAVRASTGAVFDLTPVPVETGTGLQPAATFAQASRSRVQFPAHVEPVYVEVSAETVTVDKWFQPPSQPVRARRLALATGTVLTPTEGVTVDQWSQASQQPVRRPDPQRAARAAGPTTVLPDVAVVETVTLDKWHTPPSQPVRRARSVAQSGSAPISPAALILAETVSADRFLPQVNQPIIVRHMPEAVRASSGQIPTDPYPVAPPPPGEPGTGRNPGAVVGQVSRRRIQFPSKAEPVFVATAPHVEPNLDQFPWRQAPSQPVLTRRLPTSVRASSGQAPIDPTALTAQETVTVDRWSQPVSQPVLRHALPAAVLATTGVAAGDLTPATPSEPATAGTGRNPGAVFAQRSQRRVQFPAKADVVYVAPAPHVEPSLDAFPWRQPPSQPVITRKMSAAVRASSGQAPIDPTALTAREAVTADRWAQPPSQPVRRRGLSGAIQATTGTQPADLTPGTPTEPVTAGTGYNPGAGFAQVSRRVSQYPAIVDPIYIPPPPATDELPWRQPPSQPVRARRSVANHQALAWSGYTPPYVPLPDFPLVVQADMPRPRRRDPNLQYFASVNAAIQTAPLTARVLVNWVD